MKTDSRNEVLVVNDLDRLTAEDVALFKDLISATIGDHHRIVEIDLSTTRTMDSEGVGALISVHKRLRERGGALRLSQPTPFVAQLLQLLKLDRILDVVP